MKHALDNALNNAELLSLTDDEATADFLYTTMRQSFAAALELAQTLEEREPARAIKWALAHLPEDLKADVRVTVNGPNLDPRVHPFCSAQGRARWIKETQRERLQAAAMALQEAIIEIPLIKSTNIPADSVEQIEYEVKDAGIEITVSCSGHGRKQCMFLPRNGQITKQASLLLLILMNRGRASMQQIIKGIYSDDYSRGEEPTHIRRSIHNLCTEVNKRAGVDLLLFSWDGPIGAASAATSNIVDKARKREDDNSRLGTR